MTDELMFDLNLTEEQRITRESVKRFSETEIRSVARDADEAGKTPDGLLQKTVDLGLALLPIPEEFGGAGMPRSPMSNVLTLEDLAWGDMSLALGAVTPLSFINAVLDNGSEDQKERFLTPLASEEFVSATIALMEPTAVFEPNELKTKAKKDGEKYIINGEKSMVVLGSSAKQILVIADVEGEGPQGFVVDAGTSGLSVKAADYMGLRAVDTSTLKFENVVVDAKNKLAGEGGFQYQRFIDLARIGACAAAVGTAQSVLDYVVPYVNERIAFGEPISHRQSVAFMVANIRVELDAMRVMTWRAASRAEQGLDFHKEAYLARILCAEKAMEIGTNGVQLLGGHGFCREHPVELWYRNLRAAGILEGAALV